MICKNCQIQFSYLPAEIRFYDERGICYPDLCPDCRQQRRYAARNEFFLHQRQCAKCGKNIIAAYSADKPYVIYCSDCYWSDSWDGRDYGINYDPNKPIFEHLNIIHQKIPHLASRIIQSYNSDYTNSSGHNKDCYFSFRVHYCENVYYSNWAVENKDCVDCLKVTKNELLYECVDCHRCYDCQFCFNCQNDLNCAGCVDCRNCQSCYLCSNLRNRQYCYKNQQLTEEEYRAKVKPLFTKTALNNFLTDYQKVQAEAIYRNVNQINSQNCYGDNLLNCKDCYSAFDCVDCENCLYITDTLALKDSMDCYSAGLKGDTEGIYNCWGISVNSSKIITSYDMPDGNYNDEYCQQCYNCHDCFGCTNIRNKSFCVFNKQYSPEEYQKLKDKIKAKLIKDGVYGQFLSPEYSLFCYNESPAQIYFPLTREEVLAKGWKWKEKENREYQKNDRTLPEDIREVKDEITKEILACRGCGRNYKIILQELNFYRKMNLPLPDLCFYCRHEKKMKMCNPHKLRRGNCAQCGKEVDTSFPEGTKKTIYCEECYRKGIY